MPLTLDSPVHHPAAERHGRPDCANLSAIQSKALGNADSYEYIINEAFC